MKLYSSVALATLAAAMLIATPMASAQTSSTMQTSSTSTATQAKPKAVKQTKEMSVEQRLQTLHKQLKITAGQEDRWKDFATTVRDNETRMHDHLVKRHQAVKANAVDDLRSYGEITDEHAEAIKRLVKPFEALYNTMNDAQKKNADQVFARYEGRADTRVVRAKVQ
jgi:protein CpxP